MPDLLLEAKRWKANVSRVSVPLDGSSVPGLWLNGRPERGSTEAAASILAPATGQKLASLNLANAADVGKAVEASARAATTWAKTPLRERAASLIELASRIEANLDILAAIDAKDTGSPVTAMRGSAAKGALYLRMMAGVSYEMSGRTYPASDGLHYTINQPWGVVGGISAYNHPILFACQKFGPALIAGNTVVLKPSEQAPLSTLALAALTEDLLPPSVLNIVPGSAEAGAALAAHPTIQRLTFTGGAATGLKVQAAAASSGTVKHLTLELGGKNPMVIFTDASLEQAAAAAVRGTNFTRNQGQSCGATTRLLVHRAVADSITERVVDEVSAIELGLPEDPSTVMGSLISKSHQTRVLEFIASGQAEGATLLIGGGPPMDERLASGAYVTPTVFDSVTPEMSIAREEIFGPVLSIVPWDDEDKVLNLANDSPYGLTASIWTNDIDKALGFSHDLEAGYIWVNDVETRYPGVPFGGWKLSGIGKEQALVDELISFTRQKSVNVAIRSRRLASQSGL